jgi:hypothetical protein
MAWKGFTFLVVFLLSELGVESWVISPSTCMMRNALSLRMDASQAQKTKWRGPGNPNKKSKVSSPSWGDDFVDDLTNKRFGNGWAFYGQRETLKNKDYDQLSAEAVRPVLNFIVHRNFNDSPLRFGRPQSPIYE